MLKKLVKAWEWYNAGQHWALIAMGTGLGGLIFLFSTQMWTPNSTAAKHPLSTTAVIVLVMIGVAVPNLARRFFHRD